MARVRIETALLGFIDFVIKLRVRGTVYKVRVVEENDGPKEFDGVYMEDQLRWSVAASSCNSSGGRLAFAVLEGLDDDNSDCGASERCQQEVAESTGCIGILENNGAKSLCVAVHGVDIPSNVEMEMET
ncbi:hypothetical protein A2U01_0053388 [Trifolium medium]|uniref:Uncharacterized protein n=1 Tax=Trifolium medium TaxID=97028 RepID=A0A392R8I6_9FABA|nr:hypothetical protein [Trifolium medium]